LLPDPVSGEPAGDGRGGDGGVPPPLPAVGLRPPAGATAAGSGPPGAGDADPERRARGPGRVAGAWRSGLTGQRGGPEREAPRGKESPRPGEREALGACRETAPGS